MTSIVAVNIETGLCLEHLGTRSMNLRTWYVGSKHEWFYTYCRLLTMIHQLLIQLLLEHMTRITSSMQVFPVNFQGSRPFGGAVEIARLHGCLLVIRGLRNWGWCGFRWFLSYQWGNEELRNPKKLLASCHGESSCFWEWSGPHLTTNLNRSLEAET